MVGIPAYTALRNDAFQRRNQELMDCTREPLSLAPR
jgi:hypothetical protein